MRRSRLLAGPPSSVALRYRHALADRAVRRPTWWSACSGTPRDSLAIGAGRSRRNARLARVEAVLFIAGEPLSSRKIADFASLADGTEARTLIRQLNQQYDAQGSAFRVEEVAGGFQLLTRPKFGTWLRRLHSAPVETRLSAPALETLAVVAYRQPVVRAEIEAIRGVQCGEILRQLMERDLVRIVGRSEELGRPYLYGTARRFLQTFGLRSLDELPRADSLRRTPAATAQPPSDEAKLAARRDEERTPTIDPKEESQVNQVAPQESAREDLWKLAVAAPTVLYGHARDEDDDDDFDDDEEDELDEDDDDDLDDDEDLDDDDLDDDEWEEVDDDDEDWDEDEDEDWDEDEGDEDDEDEDEDWEDE